VLPDFKSLGARSTEREKQGSLRPEATLLDITPLTPNPAIERQETDTAVVMPLEESCKMGASMTPVSRPYPWRIFAFLTAAGTLIGPLWPKLREEFQSYGHFCEFVDQVQAKAVSVGTS
jgi:hypothetical protein